MSDPFISHSEITDAIYIVCGTKKYNVTEQVIRAMRETGRLEQQRPHGEWKLRSPYEAWFEEYKCSNCNAYGWFNWHFCPNCGADMREGEAE